MELDVVEKSGSWFSYNGERIGQGRESTRLFLKSNPEICAEIDAKIREKMKDVKMFDIAEEDGLALGDDVTEETTAEEA